MSTEVCAELFGKASSEFDTVEDVDRFIEEKSGHKLDTELVHIEMVQSRGCVFPVEEMNANSIFEAALAR